jgi:hypothetical protein
VVDVNVVEFNVVIVPVVDVNVGAFNEVIVPVVDVNVGAFNEVIVPVADVNVGAFNVVIVPVVEFNVVIVPVVDVNVGAFNVVIVPVVDVNVGAFNVVIVPVVDVNVGAFNVVIVPVVEFNVAILLIGIVIVPVNVGDAILAFKFNETSILLFIAVNDPSTVDFNTNVPLVVGNVIDDTVELLLPIKLILPDVEIIVWSPIVIVALFVGDVNVTLLIVLFVNVSVPAKVANVPAVGKVILVSPVETNVVECEPDCMKPPSVDNVFPSAIVNVPFVVDTVIPLILSAVAAPRLGVINVGEVNVLFVNVSVPVIVE